MRVTHTPSGVTGKALPKRRKSTDLADDNIPVFRASDRHADIDLTEEDRGFWADHEKRRVRQVCG